MLGYDSGMEQLPCIDVHSGADIGPEIHGSVRPWLPKRSPTKT
jgi:hypothetical protein